MEKNTQSPLMDQWPDYTLESLEKVEVENRIAKGFQRYFFKLINLPQTFVVALYALMTSKP